MTRSVLRSESMSTSSYVVPSKVLLKKIGLLDDFGNKPIELTLDQLLSLEVREDGGGGPNTISSRLLIQKRQ
jgi:hypothetical protein